MKTCIVLGTRPEIIKLAPLIIKLGKKHCSIIFTGQHYDYKMSMQFIKQLELPKPDYYLKISHSNPPLQISEIISKLSKILKKEDPDTVIVQGDTNTVLASGICSIKSHIPISHVEAGLRSFDWRMPEEHNRIVIDHLSELLFCPTIISKNYLKSEKVHGEIHVTGNTIIDTINIYSKISEIKSNISIELDNFALMTLHRSENVDKKNTLTSIVKAIINSQENIIFPVHPRTKKYLKKFNLYKKLSESQNILLLDSIGYFEMLNLMKKCSYVITDSGGIQEEITSPEIQKKALILRKTSDRPESITSGFSELVGVNEKNILKSIKKISNDPVLSRRKSPYGNGKTSEKIIKILKKQFS